MKIIFLLILFTQIASLAAPASFLSSPQLSNDFRNIAEFTVLQEYDLAKNSANRLVQRHPHHPGVFVVKAIVSMSIFEDLGDTNAVNEAEKLLEKAAQPLEDEASNNENLFWSGICNMQKGYILQLKGHPIKSAYSMYQSSRQFSKLPDNLDAIAFYSIFKYYSSSFKKHIQWMPLVEYDVGSALEAVKCAARESNYFKHLFVNSLGWMFFDEGMFTLGQNLLDTMLAKYPENRTLLQMKGDFYFKAKDYKKAEWTYRRSFNDYSLVAPATIRQICAAGNLALVYDKLGDQPNSVKYFQIYTKMLTPALVRWMPPSLMKRMKEYRP